MSLIRVDVASQLDSLDSVVLLHGVCLFEYLSRLISRFLLAQARKTDEFLDVE